VPNGDPHFDLRRQEQWFAPLANGIKAFAIEHNLFIDEYYHDSPGWDLRFSHPKGGNASISISNVAPDRASIGSSWYVDDYDQFTRSIHWRGARSIPKEPALVREALEEEFHAMIGAPLGAWNQVARGYEDSWGEYTKEQFYALGPHYPKPIIGRHPQG
jgi:hypothetical protein